MGLLRRRKFTSVVLVFFLALTFVSPASAHQPFFEEQDIKADAPWEIEDPTVSTAVYATLESSEDVDYFIFTGRKGQVILLSIVIPKIEGQENFAPSMVLMGSGFSEVELPSKEVQPERSGGLLIPPPPGEPTVFFEPFTRTSYWERQEQRVELPGDGRYTVAIWDTQGQAGRYTFVIGEREKLGGDPTFPFKMKAYWTPVGSEQVSPSFFQRLFDWIRRIIFG